MSFSLLSIIPLLLVDHSQAIICGCVLFNSSGTFQSPDFPSPLGHIDCLFYHFEAPPEHFVQLIFHSFQLPSRKAGSCHSGIRLFDHSSDGLVDEDEVPDFEFCDRELTIGKSFYSRDRHFLLQLLHSESTSKGFVGEYRFLPKANFTSDAVEVSEWTWRVERSKGLLYSPEYPYFYPSYVNTTYILPQKKGHHTLIMSNDFDLGEEAILEVFETTNKGKIRTQTFTSETHSVYVTSAAPLLLHFRAGKNIKNRARDICHEHRDGLIHGLFTITKKRAASWHFEHKNYWQKELSRNQEWLLTFLKQQDNENVLNGSYNIIIQ